VVNDAELNRVLTPPKKPPALHGHSGERVVNHDEVVADLGPPDLGAVLHVVRVEQHG
jgi:hypothetical protein